MTPQQKAKELIESFELIIKHGEKYGYNNEAQRLIIKSAKESALKTVFEIRKFWNEEAYPHTHFGKWLEYWNNVKTEIERF